MFPVPVYIRKLCYLRLVLAIMESINRNRIKTYYEEGVVRPKEIHQITGIPLRTCQRIVKKLSEGQSVERKAGSGGHNKLSVNDERRIAALARNNPKYSSSRIGKKATENGTNDVHGSTIYRHLVAKGYMKLVPRKVPLLTDRHKAARVAWCLEYRSFDWTRVVFSDESYFSA